MKLFENVGETREKKLTWNPKLYIFSIISMENNAMKNILVISGVNRKKKKNNICVCIYIYIEEEKSLILFPYLENRPTNEVDCNARSQERRYSGKPIL